MVDSRDKFLVPRSLSNCTNLFPVVSVNHFLFSGTCFAQSTDTGSNTVAVLGTQRPQPFTVIINSYQNKYTYYKHKTSARLFINKICQCGILFCPVMSSRSVWGRQLNSKTMWLTGQLKGLCQEMNIFLRRMIINRYFLYMRWKFLRFFGF